jgi:hypothetical protein
MDPSNGDNSVISEEMWRAWSEKAKQREKATARKAKVYAGVVLIFLVLGSGLYLLTVR